jgi:hypothetical protein
VVVGTHLVKGFIRAMPLLDNLLHHVVAVAHPEPDRALIRLSTVKTLNLQRSFRVHYPSSEHLTVTSVCGVPLPRHDSGVQPLRVESATRIS